MACRQVAVRCSPGLHDLVAGYGKDCFSGMKTHVTREKRDIWTYRRPNQHVGGLQISNQHSSGTMHCRQHVPQGCFRSFIAHELAAAAEFDCVFALEFKIVQALAYARDEDLQETQCDVHPGRTHA